MFKKIVLLIVIVVMSSCDRNPTTVEDYDEYINVPQDTIIDKTLTDRLGGDSLKNFYSDTIPPSTVAGIGDTSSLASVYFFIKTTDSILLKPTIATLAKTAINRTSLCNFRLSSVNAMTLQAISLTGESDTLNFSFNIVNGICTTKVVKIPSGKKYEILISLWYLKKCPWDDYNLSDRSFSALDTVDLSTKNSDTLHALFRESQRMRFFVTLQIPKSIGKWTNGKTYESCIDSFAIPALYRNDMMMCNYFSRDLNGKYASEITFVCDTGKVIISFYPNLMNIISDGVVEVASKDIVAGHIYRPGIDEIPLDGVPEHKRYDE